MSHASDIAAALATRLATITKANGYNTDAGQRVYRGRLSIDASLMPCVVIIEGEDVRKDDRPGFSSTLVEQHYVLDGNLACDPDNPNDAAHDVLADIKKAIFSGDMTIGGLARRLHYDGRVISARQDGSHSISGAVKISVQYPENLSDP